MTIASLTGSRRQDLSAAGLRTYRNIARAWGLTDAQAATLLGVAGSTFRRWKAAPARVSLDPNQLERLSLLLGIYKALQVLLPRPDAADTWLKRPNRNPLFNGQRPLDRLLTGHAEDLVTVRRHLDAERGGWA